MTCGFCAEQANSETFIQGIGQAEMVYDDGVLKVYSLDDEWLYEFEINYCPMCGRRLGVER